MKTLQRGFTLIELMIVVAIIGIIVALAVPAYQDYTLRARISEGASLSAATRTAIDVAISEGYSLTALPITPASIGLVQPTSYASKYVRSVGYTNTTGEVTITLSGSEKSLGAERTKTIIYTPTANVGNLTWSVSQSGGTVSARFKPKT